MREYFDFCKVSVSTRKAKRRVRGQKVEVTLYRAFVEVRPMGSHRSTTCSMKESVDREKAVGAAFADAVSVALAYENWEGQS